MGKAGLGKVSVVQWMQHAYSDFFLSFFPYRLSYFSLSIYLFLSLSLTTTKEKKRTTKKQKTKKTKKKDVCTRTLNFFVSS